MPLKFDEDLTILNNNLLKMGSTCEDMINDVITLLEMRDSDIFPRLEAKEKEMDELQNEVDEETIRIIGVHTPVAAELRMLLMITRINIELERISDQVMNIGFFTKSLLKEDPLNHMLNIPQIAEISQEMVKMSINAFIERSTEKANAVIKKDDTVDQMHDQIFRSLMTYVIADPRTISRILELVLIARAFERIADHAVGIAEDVVFMVKGEDIRHAD